MSEADRLFEKLGYKKEEASWKEDNKKHFIEYNTDDTQIQFSIDTRHILITNILNMQELQAINKKVEELRMDIEEQWREKTLKDIQEGKVIVAYAEKDKDGNTIVRLYTENMLERCYK